MAGRVREVVLSELAYPDQGHPCGHGRENWFALGCMQHEYRHTVGYGCYVCHAMWFFEPDWRTKECREAAETLG